MSSKEEDVAWDAVYAMHNAKMEYRAAHNQYIGTRYQNYENPMSTCVRCGGMGCLFTGFKKGRPQYRDCPAYRCNNGVVVSLYADKDSPYYQDQDGYNPRWALGGYTKEAYLKSKLHWKEICKTPHVPATIDVPPSNKTSNLKIGDKIYLSEDNSHIVMIDEKRGEVMSKESTAELLKAAKMALYGDLSNKETPAEQEMSPVGRFVKAHEPLNPQIEKHHKIDTSSMIRLKLWAVHMYWVIICAIEWPFVQIGKAWSKIKWPVTIERESLWPLFKEGKIKRIKIPGYELELQHGFTLRESIVGSQRYRFAQYSSGQCPADKSKFHRITLNGKKKMLEFCQRDGVGWSLKLWRFGALPNHFPHISTLACLIKPGKEMFWPAPVEHLEKE